MDNEHQDVVNVTPDTVLEGSIYRIRFNYLGPIPYNFFFYPVQVPCILGDPGADIEGEGKSRRAGKYGPKKSKERREKTGQKNTNVFWHQSEGRTAATVWNWSGKTLSPGALLAVLYFSSCHIFPPV